MDSASRSKSLRRVAAFVALLNLSYFGIEFAVAAASCLSFAELTARCKPSKIRFSDTKQPNQMSDIGIHAARSVATVVSQISATALIV